MALFDRFPRLRDTLPHTSLAGLPTLVKKLANLGKAIGAPELYVKRDDLTGQTYGGNKVRKLEFLLGQTLAKGAKEVMTFGCAGSNHATATAVYAHQLGLRSISMLLPQPNAHSVRRNLLLSHRSGAELHFYSNLKAVPIGVYVQMLEHRRKQGVRPDTIPAGGSSPLGAVGYVNAAIELADQIAAGLLPEPGRIYVPAGTMGTTAGLLVGLKAAGLETRVIPVRVTDERFVNILKLIDLANSTAAMLHKADPLFPELTFTEKDVTIRHDFFGEQYALYTPESVEAVHLFHETEGLKLEGTYTGKTAATLVSDARNGQLADKPTLFWNTYNSRDVSTLIADIDYHDLPRPFHRYFDEDVQPLDK